MTGREITNEIKKEKEIILRILFDSYLAKYNESQNAINICTATVVGVAALFGAVFLKALDLNGESNPSSLPFFFCIFCCVILSIHGVVLCVISLRYLSSSQTVITEHYDAIIHFVRKHFSFNDFPLREVENAPFYRAKILFILSTSIFAAQLSISIIFFVLAIK